MCFLDLLNDVLVFRSFRLENNIGQILADKRLVCGDFNNIQFVDFAEFLRFGGCRTRHTGKLFVKAEIVLEGDGGKRFAFVLNLNALFCLDGLVQAVVVSSAEHNTAGKFVNDKHLAVLNNIIYVLAHNADCLDCLVDMVKQRCVFHIHQVFNAEIFLGFFNASLSKRCRAGFFVNHEIAVICVFGVLLFVHLGNLVHFEGARKIVCPAVKVGGLIAAAADDKGCSRLIDKNGVNLVHDCEIVASLHLLLFIKHHVVSQIIEAHFVVGAVGDIAVVCLLALRVCFFVNDKACAETEKTVKLAHPFAVALCKVIVYGNDMHALALKRVKVSRQSGHEGFAFAGFHFGNSALVQNDAADNLHIKVLHSEHSPRALAANRESIGQNIVKRFACGKPVFQNLCLGNKLFVAHFAVFIFKRHNLVCGFLYPLNFFCGIIAEDSR